MKLTKKQIEIIRENTPVELKGTHKTILTDFGYYQKSGANWNYRSGYVRHNGQMFLVVEVFGEII